MKKKILFWILITPLALILVFCGITYIYFSFFFYDPYIYPHSSWQPKEGSFLIEPETILDSLKNGEADVFIPNLEQEDTELPKVIYNAPVNWTPREYLIIAEALNQKAWKDSLDDWELLQMIFQMDCQDNPSGFDNGYLIYFKIFTNDEGHKSYTIREFSIAPKYGLVTWRGGASAPRPLFGWKSVDLGRMIDAYDAIKIAEDSGGKEIRLKLKNDCRIRLSLAPEWYADGWDIWYRVDNLSEFQISINPYNGKINKRWWPE